MLSSTPGAGKATPGANNIGDLVGAGQWMDGWESNRVTDPGTRGQSRLVGWKLVWIRSRLNNYT